MATWHLIFQRDELPISLVRADGVRETPPPGLIRYVELARGAWTLEPATAPSGIEAVEWPRPCVWNCGGTMAYVEHVAKPVFMGESGQSSYPSGWQCDTCKCEEVGGFSALGADWIETDPETQA